MKTKLLSFIILFFIPILLWSQTGKISGKVIDENGEGLPGVNVVLPSTQTGASTDINGEYVILNLQPGIYEIRASTVGYQTVTQTDVQVRSNQTTKIDFQLNSTVVDIGKEVVVMAEKPLVERDQTSTRHFVDANEISSRPTTQLTQILSTLPGIDMNAAGELTVRRGSLDQVAFLIDGVRARNPLDFQPYTNINLTSIQELEIITGGFNAEYGEAQSGVFNIITKDGTQQIETYSELRWTPPGKKHWGTEFYDYSTTRYWENTHARHLQWWIDNPDQWVDPNGVKGNDPNSIWSPEVAYQDYMNTHQPMTDYTDESTYQTEISLGGPLPIPNMYFFITGKYRSAPPVTGNSFRTLGSWFDGTAKINYNISPQLRLQLSGFFSNENSSYGMNSLQIGGGFENKYAYYDFPGYPKNRVDNQTLKLTHVLGQDAFYELQFSRVFRYRSQGVFPGDTDGWETGAPQYDKLRAVDENGTPIFGGYNNIIGMHTTGYYYRGEDKNTDYTLSGDYTNQINPKWQLKGGFDFTYLFLDRFQEGKANEVTEKDVYEPYEGNIYAQNKLEFEGLIMNIGLRYDFYNPNDVVYLDPFDPFDLIAAQKEGREPNPKTEPTKLYGQLSPRIGISHPISDQTVLHFSYGHFFQRAGFGDYGEGTGSDVEGQRVSGILNSLLGSAGGYLTPYNLGNRNLKPRKTVAYELGIEHNIAGIVADITAFYKDITNTIRSVRIFMPTGSYYITTGNSNYADAKGLEVAIRKPLSGFWGGYLNYTWSTGISGRSGDPDVIAAPGSGVQTRVVNDVGDYIQYDPSRLKFGLTFATPSDLSFLGGLFSNVQIALDYQIYYPHKKIISDNYSEGGKSFIRSADKNADLRIRKDFSLFGFNPAIFFEVHNVFNDRWINFETLSQASLEDRVQFVNSNFSIFPEVLPTGAPFPDQLQYRNLPRSIVFGIAIGFRAHK